MQGAREPFQREPPAWRPSSAPAPHALDRGDHGRGWLACRACGARVADTHARIRVDGAHEHAFINPAGTIFRIGCFAEAPGTCPLGRPSSHWTWFAGYHWRAACCRGCAEHLGWEYARAGEAFFGLILDRLVERGAPERPAG